MGRRCRSIPFRLRLVASGCISACKFSQTVRSPSWGREYWPRFVHNSASNRTVCKSSTAPAMAMRAGPSFRTAVTNICWLHGRVGFVVAVFPIFSTHFTNKGMWRAAMKFADYRIRQAMPEVQSAILNSRALSFRHPQAHRGDPTYGCVVLRVNSTKWQILAPLRPRQVDLCLDLETKRRAADVFPPVALMSPRVPPTHARARLQGENRSVSAT